MPEDRPSPMRITRKASFIIDEVHRLTKIKKSKIVDNALSKEYPLFAEIFDKDEKK